MAKELNRFLTTLDAGFLYAERPREPLHIGSCMIYEGRMELAELEQLLRDRLHLVPRYRQRAVFPPLNVSHPLWLDDPDFDLDHHLKAVELEGEVGPAELARAAAEVYGGMLDRDRPLWSITLLHGLPGDNTAAIWKVHHAMIDGVSGVDLTMVLNDFSPTPEPPQRAAEEWSPQPLPDPLSLLQEAVQHRLAEVAKDMTDRTFDSFRPEKIAERMRRFSSAGAASLPRVMTPAPRTPFNRPVSGKLGYAWAQFPFTELRQVKSVLGGTVNDLVLAILSGGLGRYLRGLGERTEGVELRAMCPVSMRAADQQGRLGNLVSMMIAPLFVGIEDPLERLEAEREAMASLKDAGQAEAFYDMTQLGSGMSPAWMAMAGMLMPGVQTVFNTVSTNVPGPQIPLYQNGRRLLAWLPMGVVSSNIGLFVAILTYNQTITLGLTVDAELVPDPWAVARALEESYRELRAVSGVEPEEPSEAIFTSAAPKGARGRGRGSSRSSRRSA
ncbi:MAG: wax ester/triacylglycerol synthase family O-acyltransferase [Thermoanaerobaculia bacterium]|nr:wax ester/triacylglycerol synthase family O-acyltransferase [Thermoanaerobaculia bacterium]